VGYALAAAAAALWGTSGVVSKFLFRSVLRPMDVLSLRTTLAAVIILLWVLLTAPSSLRVRFRDLTYFALLGVIGLAANQYLYYVALDLTSVGFALLLQYTAPILLMIYGVLAKTERITGGKLLSAACSLIGCALMVLGHAGGMARVSLPGVACALGGAVGFAFYTGYGKSGLRRFEARTVLSYAFLFSTAVWLVLRPAWKMPLGAMDSATWLLILYLGSVATVLPFGLYLASLRYLEASRANLTATLEPVVASAIAWVVLSETMSGVQVLGGMAIVAGVAFLQLEREPS
jgi:drug/metabolite transporter (DMT)-like permease